MLQRLCCDKADWDDEIPDEMRSQWEKWRSELHLVKDLSIPRCFKPDGFGKVSSAQMHHFSDASTTAYGQCSYLRLKDDKGRVHCSLVMGKSRVTPLAPVTIPRLELTAAVVSSRVSRMLHHEIEYGYQKELFWCDSKIVLGYINNDVSRYHVYVANRVQQIRSRTSPEQWKYVDTKSNPADDASRGLSSKELLEGHRWFLGPDFLYLPEDEWPTTSKEQVAQLLPEDPEVKKVISRVTSTEDTWSLIDAVKYFSDWYRAKKAVAVCLRYKQILRARVSRRKEGQVVEPSSKKSNYQPVTVEEIEQARIEIIRAAQASYFSAEIAMLRSPNVQEDNVQRTSKKRVEATVKKGSSLHRLDPFIDCNGVITVGGRIRRADMSVDIKFPMIIPRKGHLTELIIRHHHQKVKRQGRGMTHNEIRSSGFWIIGGSSAISDYIYRCVDCRKLRGAVEEQKMADLPQDRLEPCPPFTYSAVDVFGPWYIKEGRRELKRYGVLFTCMVSRAVHIEVANTMDTSSFINAYRRFVGRRGPVRQLRSDQGTNFVGARNELREALSEMNHDEIHKEMSKSNCDWVVFKMNVPHASHMGGVWERQIRTVRNVLSGLLSHHGCQLDDEGLRTLMIEAEAIVNSRPLTVNDMSCSDNPEPLTPNHLLTMKSKVVLPPPGVFPAEDKYARKRWRRVQHLANEFWSRWRREFLQSLQERVKWTKPRRNLEVDDVVIVKDNNVARNQWQLGRVLKANPDEDGLVRTVSLVLADSSISSCGKRVRTPSVLERPIQKLVLLLSEH